MDPDQQVEAALKDMPDGMGIIQPFIPAVGCYWIMDVAFRPLQLLPGVTYKDLGVLRGYLLKPTGA